MPHIFDDEADIPAIILLEQSTVPPDDLPPAGKHKILVDDSSPVRFLIVDSAGTTREIAMLGSTLPANFGAGVIKTLDASGFAAAGADRHLIIAANTGTSDTLSEITGLSVGDEVVIRADAGDTITVEHNAAGATDKILLHNAANLDLSGDQTLKLLKTVAGKVVQYVDEAGGDPAPSPEIFLTAAGGWPSTTGGCAANTKNEYGTNDLDLYSLDFDQTTEEYAQWSVWMPDDWDAGTITAKFVWSAASGTGDVIWALQGRSFANDDAIDQSWGTAQTVTDTLLATGDIHYSSVTSAITLAGGPAAGELVQFRVYRDADAGGDTLNADARLLGVKLYFTRA